MAQDKTPPRRARRGSGAVTLHDVAKLAGVAPITASRALNHPTQVSDEVRQKVREALARTGYVPNRLAGGLASTRSRLVAAVVPTIAGPAITVSEFNAGTAITYSLTPDGWNPEQDQATVTDDRLTLAQTLQRPGKKTKGLTLKYVDATTGAALVLTEGTSGFIVIRPLIPNATAVAAAQKVVVWPVLCGEQEDDGPVANGVFTKSQKLFVIGVVTRQAVAA